MSARLSARTALAASLLAGSVALAACSGGIGGAPSTTAKPYTVEEMCVAGHNTFVRIDELDRTKPDFVDKLKEIVKGFGDRAPEAIYYDLKAWVDYILAVTDPAQLDPLPADLTVSTKRVDDWWKANCGKAFGSS